MTAMCKYAIIPIISLFYIVSDFKVPYCQHEQPNLKKTSDPISI